MDYSMLTQLSEDALRDYLVTGVMTSSTPLVLPSENNLIEGSLLHGLALSGRLGVLIALLQESKNPPIMDLEMRSADGRGVLHWLALGAQSAFDAADSLARVQEMEWLLAQGVTLDSEDHGGNTALHLACGAGHPAFIYGLIAKGACSLPNNAQKTPLDIAKSTRLSASSNTIDASSALISIGSLLQELPEWEVRDRFSLTSAYASAAMAYLTYKGNTQDTAAGLASPNGAVLALCERWGFSSVHIASQLGLWGMVASNANLTVVAFRGTKVTLNWIWNLSAVIDLHDTGERHLGFSESLNRLWSNLLPYIPQRAQTPIWITGHSLGGAISTLATDNLLKTGIDPQRLVLYTFAQPRVGTEAFQARFDKACINAHMIIAAGDPVPTVPPTSAGYRHSGSVRYLDKQGQLYNAHHYQFHDIARACQHSAIQQQSSLFKQWLRGFKQLHEQERIAQKEPIKITSSNLPRQLGLKALAHHGMSGYFSKVRALLLQSRSAWQNNDMGIMTQQKSCRFPSDYVKPMRYEQEKRGTLASWVKTYTHSHPPVFDLVGDAVDQVDWFLQEQAAVIALTPYYHGISTITIPSLTQEQSGISSLMQKGLRSSIAWALTQTDPATILQALYQELPMGWALAAQGDNQYVPVSSVNESPYKMALVALLERAYQQGVLPMVTYATVLMTHWEYVSTHSGVEATHAMLDRLRQLPIRLSQRPLEWQPRFLHHYFWSCAEKGDIESLRACMQWGAEMDVASKTGKTALMYALSAGQMAVVQTLLASGAQTRELLHATDLEDNALLLQLLAYGADLNALNPRGESVLHQAVMKRSLSCVNRLLSLGANPNLLNTAGKTPLHLAVNNKAIWSALVSQGAHPSIPDAQGCTAYKLQYGVSCPVVLPPLPWEGTVYHINETTLGINTVLTLSDVEAIVHQACDPRDVKSLIFSKTCEGHITIVGRGTLIETLLDVMTGQLTSSISEELPMNRVTYGRQKTPWCQRAITQVQVKGMERSPVVAFETSSPITHFAVQGHKVAYTTQLGCLQIMDKDTGQSLGQWSFNGAVTALTVCAGLWCVGLNDGHVLIGDDNDIHRRIKVHQKAVTHQHSRGNSLVIAGADNTVSLLSIPSFRISMSWTPHRKGISALHLLPDNSVLIGSIRGHIRRWNNTKTSLVTYSGHKKAVRGLVDLPDGRIASISDDKTLRLWHVWDGKSSAQVTLKQMPQAIQVTRAGDIAIKTADHTLRYVMGSGEIQEDDGILFPDVIDDSEQSWFKEKHTLRYCPLEVAVSVDLSDWIPEKLVSFYPQLMKKEIIQLHCPMGTTAEQINQLEMAFSALLAVFEPEARIENLCIVSRDLSSVLALCQALSRRLHGPWALNDSLRCAALRRQLTSTHTVDTLLVQQLIKHMENLSVIFENTPHLPTVFELLCCHGGEPAVSWVLMHVDSGLLKSFVVPQHWKPRFLQYAFWKAAKTDDVVLFERCLQAGVDPLACSGSGKTALDYAKVSKATQIENYWVAHDLSKIREYSTVPVYLQVLPSCNKVEKSTAVASSESAVAKKEEEMRLPEYLQGTGAMFVAPPSPSSPIHSSSRLPIYLRGESKTKAKSDESAVAKKEEEMRLPEYLQGTGAMFVAPLSPSSPIHSSSRLPTYLRRANKADVKLEEEESMPAYLRRK
ncbi:MAG: ankyrin repeat domain-containing protein [Gammaproteobacteria bacterium]